MVIGELREDGKLSQPIHVSLKTVSVILGLVGLLLAGAIAFFSLYFFPKTAGEALAINVAHHIKNSVTKHNELDDKVKKLEDEKDSLLNAVHRIELRQVAADARRLPAELKTVPVPQPERVLP